ncbi:MAG: VOC family protein [Desulfovibrio sp.]|nr:VOC family protein [Desulfovibrio sp.]
MTDLRFHHIGVATRSLAESLPRYRFLGYAPESQIFEDTGQGIRGVFLTAHAAPRVELLENLHADGPLTSWLARGVRLYHWAYESLHLEDDLDALVRQCGAKIFRPITVATFFARICFAMLPDMTLVELVECKAECKKD